MSNSPLQRTEDLLWLRQCAAVDGNTYDRLLLHLLERVESLEARPIPGTVELVSSTPEAAPVATDGQRLAMRSWSSHGPTFDSDLVEFGRNCLNLGRQHGAAQLLSLEKELERERLRLAACGVVAMADTPESAAKARDIDPSFQSASLDDVARQVDALMEARAALAQPEGEGPTLDKIDEMELLRVYCNARRAYCHDGPEHINWQRDAERGATLAGLGAVLARWGHPAALPAPEHVGGSINDEQRETVRAAVAEALGDTYDCTRVWEAWQVGTMGPDDFVLVAEDDDRVAEIADAAIEAICPTAPPAPEVGEVGLLVDRLNQVAGDFEFLCNKIVNGECRTLACLRRGGYDDELCSARCIKPPDPLVATCPALEKAGAMRRAATLLQQSRWSRKRKLAGEQSQRLSAIPYLPHGGSASKPAAKSSPSPPS